MLRYKNYLNKIVNKSKKLEIIVLKLLRKYIFTPRNAPLPERSKEVFDGPYDQHQRDFPQ